MKILIYLTMLFLILVSTVFAYMPWVQFTLTFKGDIKEIYKQIYGIYVPDMIEATLLHNANKAYYIEGDTIELMNPPLLSPNTLNVELVQNGVAVYTCDELKKILDEQLFITWELFKAKNGEIGTVYNCP